ncbi:VWA domain-containing protein [Paenibacillus sp. FSL R5-0407]|uniref:VWA domain-containing protein n=1 Tax=Paenibacillus sp. FSL R5-0407 TaxID=2975320 RepID=UPI0030F7BE15
MVVRKMYTLVLLSFLLLAVSACSSKEKASDADPQPAPSQNNSIETAEQTGPKKEAEDGEDFRPYQTEDVMERLLLAPGKFSGEQYDEAEVKRWIDQFPEGKTAEEYYARLLSLVAEDYRPYHKLFSQYDTSYQDASAIPEEREQPGSPGSKQLNVQILFDASGSMAGKIGGETRIDLAKDAVNSFVSELPENTNVSLRVYGHKGSGKNSDRELSCSSTEEIYALAPYQEESFGKALNQFAPAGWTPLGASIEAAHDDLQFYTGENTENIIYIVSDGVETCGGDPVGAAKKLNESAAKAIVNIIGFDVDDEGQQQLKQVAEAGKGKYTTVRTKQEIEDFFKKEKHRLIEEWFAWESENVGQYFQSEQTRVDEMFKKEKEMIELVYSEQEHLDTLSNYVDEKFDVNGREIRDYTRKLGFALREYARKTAFGLREELRDKGLEHRNEVRDQGLEERQNLRNSGK